MINIISALGRISEYFPELNIRTDSEKSLILLGINPKKYLFLSFLLSFVFSVPVTIIFGLTLPFFLFYLAILLVFLLALPKLEQMHKTKEIEAEIPFFIRSVGIFLEIGIPLERAIIAAKGDGRLSYEIERITKQINNGTSFQRAFSGFAVCSSPMIKRVASHLISSYETGGSGTEMIKLGDELLSLEQHRMKDYGSRSAMFGLLFIIASAILPTFFLVYVIVGQMGLGIEITLWQVEVALLVIFPLISSLILLFSKSTVPVANEKGFDLSILLPGAVFLVGFIFFQEWQFLFLILGAIIACLLVYSTYRKESRIEEIENSLPDALFSVSGMPKGTPIGRVFQMLEEGEHGVLSKEAGKSRKQILMNVRMENVFDDLWMRNNSNGLKRVTQMLRQMLSTNSLHRMNIIAEDMLANGRITRERSQLFGMQKYTLILGAVLVPVILRMTLNLLGSLVGLGSGEFLAGGAGTEDFIVQITGIIPPYLLIYATISSAAIADGEGRKSAGGIYFILLSILSLSAFYFINLGT